MTSGMIELVRFFYMIGSYTCTCTCVAGLPWFLYFSADESEDGFSASNIALRTLSFHVPNAIRMVEFSPSGSYLVACCEEKKIKLWTAPDWTATMERYGGFIRVLVHVSQGGTLKSVRYIYSPSLIAQS